jgi:phosphoadenosine phosphosulfate reductase
MNRDDVSRLARELKDAGAPELLRFFIEKYAPKSGAAGGKDRIALATALGAEGQVLTHMIMNIRPESRIFILDTGRLPEETHRLISRMRERFGIRYEIYFPDTGDIEEMESLHGPNLFYDSVEQRMMCCNARKVKPLKRVLRTLDVWITGLRRGQSVTRDAVERIEWDEGNGIIKLNPLADWSEEEVWDYIRTNDLPYNTLYDDGYPSIGCAPCTRPVVPGEDPRSGRWWWEHPNQRECGLHLSDGKLVGRKRNDD